MFYTEDAQCTYCGTRRSLEREHVVPAVWFGHRSYNRAEQWIVPSCKECNMLAGVAVFFSIPEKAAYIAKRYATRYKKILRLPIWTEEEIEKESYKIQDSIRAGITQKSIIRNRIKNLEIVATYDKDYLKPEWVKKEMIKMEQEYKRLRNALKRTKKKNTSKGKNAT